ncbi:uncharacterized protein [Mytilus edulis]|uniref:uncharacterized protein n=1 Tax=Mytilus edulis TaxID=6550 RepID=UPI0039EF42F9
MDPYLYATTGNIASQRLLEHSDVLSGWVRRQNFLKKWKKKFTILYDGRVYTYKNETSTKQIEEFSLKEFISVDTSIHRKGTKQLWVLDIFPAHTTNKSKHFAFPSAKDLTIWADRFSTEIRFYNENKYSYSKLPYSSFDKAWSKECLSDNATKYIHGDENLESSSQCHPSTKSVTSIYGSGRKSSGSVPVSCSEKEDDDFEDYVDALSSNSYSSRQSMTSLQGYEIEGSDKACKDSTFKSSDLQVGVGRRPLPTPPSSPKYHRKTTTGKEHINKSKYLFGKTF